MGLLITRTHHSELHVITALSLIFTLYKSPQHPLSLHPACCVFISHFLATASNWRFFSFPRSRRYFPANIPQLNSRQLSTGPQRHLFSASLAELTCTANPQLTTELVNLIAFKITYRHGPHRKRCLRVRSRGSMFAEPLLRNGRLLLTSCIATAVVVVYFEVVV
jgi:hypothetical protein